MKKRTHTKNKYEDKKIRYAVVGLGWISQVAVLPAFAHAKPNSELVALVSADNEKLKKLGKKYGVEALYHYEQYEECLRSSKIDAVYIALPNNLHREYAVAAARAGVHVLCEKPMAVTEPECEEMIQICRNNRVKLMIAYRLHFEKANLKAAELVESGKLGRVRYFNSTFSFRAKEDGIRLKGELGGGPLLDVGIYCINAARTLFQSEPTEVFAFTANNRDDRSLKVEEMVAATMRFPEDRLATFVCSHGAGPTSSYEVVGTKGSLRVDPAYGFYEDLKHHLTLKEKTRTTVFRKRDQFAPELLYFSDCVLNDVEPEPSGEEGLNDVRIIQAIYRSANEGRTVKLEKLQEKEHPTIEQAQKLPPVEKQELVHSEAPEKAA